MFKVLKYSVSGLMAEVLALMRIYNLVSDHLLNSLSTSWRLWFALLWLSWITWPAKQARKHEWLLYGIHVTSRRFLIMRHRASFFGAQYFSRKSPAQHRLPESLDLFVFLSISLGVQLLLCSSTAKKPCSSIYSI